MSDASGAHDVKQRALKVTWKTDIKPTEDELISAFCPYREIARVKVKELAAAVLFVYAESVAAAVEGSWDDWNVRPMARLPSRDTSPALYVEGTAHEAHAVGVDHRARSLDTRVHASTRENKTSKSWKAVRGLAAVPAGLKSVAMMAVKRGGLVPAAKDGEVQIDPAAKRDNIQTVGDNPERNVYPTPLISAVQYSQGQGGGVGAHQSRTQRRTTRQQAQGNGTSKEWFSSGDQDPLALQQLQSPPFCSRPDGSDTEGGTDYHRSRHSTSTRQRRPRMDSPEDIAKEHLSLQVQNIAEMPNTYEGSTRPGVASAGATKREAEFSRNTSGSESRSPRKVDTLDDALGESQALGQDVSPLSSPEAPNPLVHHQGREYEPGETIDVEAGVPDAPRGYGECIQGTQGQHSGKTQAYRGRYENIDDDAMTPITGRTTPEITENQNEATSQQQSDRSLSCLDEETLSVPIAAPGVATETAYSSLGEQPEEITPVPNGEKITVAQEGQGICEGRDQESAAHTKKTKDQAKRLALEVARLRSALRGTASELKTERAIRVRAEDQWWEKLREWEEERGCLVTAKQEAERATGVAEEEASLLREKVKAREIKTASEHAAWEAAQHKAGDAMKGVVKVQDRLVEALQTELDVTNRAREAAQDDARDSKEQLRFYVADFLLWRDRAKRLEACLVELGHPQPWFDEGNPPSCGMAQLLSPSMQHQRIYRKAKRDKGLRATACGEGEDDGNNQSDLGNKDAESVDSRSSARHVLCGCEESSPTLSSPRMRSNEPSGSELGDRCDMNSASFETTRYSPDASSIGKKLGRTVPGMLAGYPAGSVIRRAPPTSRSYFERSMKAQQEVSARLEKDLIKARADLQSIYSKGSTTGGCQMRLVSSTEKKNTSDDGDIEVMDEATSLAGIRGEAGPDRMMARSGDADAFCSPDDVPQDNHHLQCTKAGGGPIGVGEHERDDIPANTKSSHMARVLTVLLGRDKVAETSVGRGRGSTAEAPPPLSLSDFAPMVQEVFGEEPAVLPSPIGTESGQRMVSVDERFEGTHHNGDLRKHGWSRYNPATEIMVGRVGGEGNASNDSNHPTASTTERTGVSAACTYTSVAGRSRDDGSGRIAPRQEERAAVRATRDTGDLKSFALAEAFRDYEAKSPLLQKWMDEKISSVCDTALYRRLSYDMLDCSCDEDGLTEFASRMAPIVDGPDNGAS